MGEVAFRAVALAAALVLLFAADLALGFAGALLRDFPGAFVLAAALAFALAAAAVSLGFALAAVFRPDADFFAGLAAAAFLPAVFVLAVFLGAGFFFAAFVVFFTLVFLAAALRVAAFAVLAFLAVAFPAGAFFRVALGVPLDAALTAALVRGWDFFLGVAAMICLWFLTDSLSRPGTSDAGEIEGRVSYQNPMTLTI